MSANLFVGEPAGPPVYLDDFEPFLRDGRAVRDPKAHAMSHERVDVKGAWGLVKGYCGARKGQMLVATRGQAAPVLSFTPGVRGRYAIYVGAFSKRAFQFWDGFGAFVRLGAHENWTLLLNERAEPSFEEMYFATADLDEGSRIEIAHFQLGKSSSWWREVGTGMETETTRFEFKTFLSHLKLVPVKSPPLPAATKATIGILDFADDVPLSHPRERAAASAVWRHAEMGYTMIMWKAGNGMVCEYPTKIGKVRDDASPIGEMMREFDVMRQAVVEAKRIGIPIYGWSRLLRDAHTKGKAPPPTPFHAAHPDQVQTSKDGTQSWKLSFAFPEARQHMTDMLCEIAAYGMDGVFVDLLRHPPVVQYDRPLVEAFRARTGQDPREMEGDGTEDWLRFRAEAFTLFLRETRAALDRQAGGRRYPLIVRTVDQPWRNLQIGCDVEAWMREGLLDGVIFAPHLPLGANYPESQDLRSQIAMAQGRTKVYGQVWRQSSGSQAELLARDLYAQGVDGVALYESNLTVELPSLRERLWKFSRPQSLS